MEKKQKEKTTTTTETAKENKPIWHQAEKILIKSVLIVREPKDKTLLKAIKFITNNDREIFYYAVNKVDTHDKIGSWNTEVTETKKFIVSEFILNQKLLNFLNIELQKGEVQEVVLTYQEKLFNGVIYYTMGKNQYDSIHYPLYHKEDKSNLEKQLTAKEKYMVGEEIPQ